MYAYNNEFVCTSFIDVLKDVIETGQEGIFLGAPPKLVQELQDKKCLFSIVALILI